MMALRLFLGITSYYLSHTFAKVAEPLHKKVMRDLLWTKECQRQAPHLVGLHEALRIGDRCLDSRGAVLVQKQEDGSVRPIPYAS